MKPNSYEIKVVKRCPKCDWRIFDGEEKGCAISTLSERRKRILRDLKKVLKNFAE